MASTEDLAEVMQNALERSGDLALLRVQLEDNLASITSRSQTLSHIPGLSKNVEVTKPEMPHEIVLINELIREYLTSIGAEKTASVLVAESGLPEEPMSRLQLRKALAAGTRLDGNGSLLSIMVDHYLRMK